MSLATSSFLRTIIKAVESHLGQRLPRFRRGTVVGQSGNPLKVLVSPSGEQGVADGFEYPVLRSYTSVTVDDPGGPHVGDDLLVLETTPNNPVLLGQLLTGPNDKANRDSYPGIDKVSITQNDAKKLRAHAIAIDHVPPIDADVPATARDGMFVTSTFDNSLWKRVSGTWYQVGATKWGAVVDTDGFIDVWIAASVTLPTDGTGDQTAHTTPGYTPTVYNTSALGLDGGAGHAAYVKHDQKSITQTADGKLRAQAIKVIHALPPTDADIPATAEDGALVDATTDDSLWMRSSGALVRVSIPAGGTTGQVLAKIDNSPYNVHFIDAEDPNCACLDLPSLISLIGSITGAGGGSPSGGIHYTAESTYLGNGPGNAFDGDPSTAWGSDTRGAGPWLQVDFGVPVPVHQTNVVQVPGTAPWDPPGTGSHQMSSYEIQASSNGSTWVTIASHSGGIPLGGDVLTFPSATYRYWRMLCTGEPSFQGTAIQEFHLT